MSSSGGHEGRVDERGAVQSVAWTVLSFGGSRLIVFCVTLVLAALLSPADFGVVAAGLAVLAYLEIGLDVGVGSALIYEQEKGVTRRVQTAFTLNLGVALLFTVAGLLAAPALAVLLRVPEHVDLLRLLFCSVLIRGAGQVQDAILRRDLRFKERTVVDLSRAVVRAAVSIGVALVAPGPAALVIGIVASEAVGTAANFLLVRFRPTLALDADAAGALLRFGGVVVGLKVLGVVFGSSDYLVVGNRLGPEALGLYSMAYRLPELLIANMYYIFSTVAFSVYARSRSSDPASFQQVMLRALTLLSLFGFAAGTGLAIVSRDLVHTLFEDRWLPAALPMALIALMLAVSSVGYASGDIFLAIGRPGLLFAVSAPVTAVTVVGFILAAPHGIVMVAVVHLVLMVVYSTARLLLAGRVLRVPIADSLAALRPAAVATAGVVATALPVQLLTPPGPSGLAASTVVGAAGCVGALALLSRGTLVELRRLLAHAVAR
ncbi:MAG: oligosaccharide flippase family protein [Actinomycetota bacterium]|nr:oligosaccharide flippase family protein [Actinomycetota bacterium]